MPNYRLILSMALPPRRAPYRQIQVAAGCSPREISRAKTIAKSQGILTLNDLNKLSDAELDTLFVDKRRTAPEDYVQPDFDAIISKMVGKTKPTLQDLWAQYAEQDPGDKKLYGLDRFRQLVRAYIESKDYSSFIEHIPGNTMQVDWTGEQITMHDAATGEVVKLPVFIASLPYSGLFVAVAAFNMKAQAWYEVHVSAFEYFGGTPNFVIPDNAPTATNRTPAEWNFTRREVLNSYQEFLNHYGVYAIPARVYKPQDKGNVEAHVKIVTRRIISQLNGQAFVDIDQVNKLLRELSDQENLRPRPRRGRASRREEFEAYERSQLSPLPPTRWVRTQRLIRRVNRDWCVEIGKAYYSVPRRWVGQHVDVLICGDQIKIMSGNELIAEHQRAKRQWARVINPEHAKDALPDGVLVWSAPYFIKQAHKVGPYTTAVIKSLVDVDDPTGNLRTAHGILQLAKVKTADAEEVLEAACGRIVETGQSQHRRVSVNLVKTHMATVRENRARATRTATDHPGSHRLLPQSGTAQAYLAGLDNIAANVRAVDHIDADTTLPIPEVTND